MTATVVSVAIPVALIEIFHNFSHVLFAPLNVLDSLSNVQSVSECQVFCKNAAECRSFVFYDGGCIFLSVTDDALPGRREIVFYINYYYVFWIKNGTNSYSIFYYFFPILLFILFCVLFAPMMIERM